MTQSQSNDNTSQPSSRRASFNTNPNVSAKSSSRGFDTPRRSSDPVFKFVSIHRYNDIYILFLTLFFLKINFRLYRKMSRWINVCCAIHTARRCQAAPVNGCCLTTWLTTVRCSLSSKQTIYVLTFIVCERQALTCTMPVWPSCHCCTHDEVRALLSVH